MTALMREVEDWYAVKWVTCTCLTKIGHGYVFKDSAVKR